MSLGPKSLAPFSAFSSPVEKHICSRSGRSQRALTSSRKEALKIQLPLPPSPNSHSQKVRLKDFGGACSWTFCADSRTTSAWVTDSVWHLSAGHMYTQPSLPFCSLVHGSFLSLLISSRVPSTMTCAGRVNTSLWYGSMLLSCLPHSCCHPNTAICYINQLLI